MYRDTEENIEQFFGISNEQYDHFLDAIVRHKERRIGRLKNILVRRELLLPGYELEFVAETNTLGPYQVFWKVKKGGQMAISKDCNGRWF
ncbi:hypothetical protein AS030_07880 [Fictibacillus enclensis]|uniref:Adenylyl/Guanylyl and SMODS C-terminal sensor domain-containing protein n=1 Tax=Fictibacillus enclensis TaxID=1017270 RepID=A0A0V8JEH0_9BACL|nr:hypothetical protein AS030_07880 [Fictibacillus enclensis]